MTAPVPIRPFAAVPPLRTESNMLGGTLYPVTGPVGKGLVDQNDLMTHPASRRTARAEAGALGAWPLALRPIVNIDA